MRQANFDVASIDIPRRVEGLGLILQVSGCAMGTTDTRIGLAKRASVASTGSAEDIVKRPRPSDWAFSPRLDARSSPTHRHGGPLPIMGASMVAAL